MFIRKEKNQALFMHVLTITSLKDRRIYYLHNAHPPSSNSLTTRMHLWFICSKGSMSSTLPATLVFSLCSIHLLSWNKFWQYLQYHVPLGIHGRDTHSATIKISKLYIKSQSQVNLNGKTNMFYTYKTIWQKW